MKRSQLVMKTQEGTANRAINHHGQVLGNMIAININIENTYKSEIDFTLFGIPYTFIIDKWARRGLSKFLEMFFDSPRDVVKFGVMTEDANGGKQFWEDTTDLTFASDGSCSAGPSARAMTMYQKLNAVQQACEDVITCLNQIGQIHQRSLLEYCLWYRESHKQPGNYREYITLVTSHSVVHNDFMAPNVVWTLVEFH
jgi:hypothetical protein